MVSPYRQIDYFSNALSFTYILASTTYGDRWIRLKGGGNVESISMPFSLKWYKVCGFDFSKWECSKFAYSGGNDMTKLSQLSIIHDPFIKHLDLANDKKIHLELYLSKILFSTLA